MSAFPIVIVREKILPAELIKLAKQGHGEMVKFVADLERKVITAGGELHADAEAILLEDGSKQQNLWGANLYLYENTDKKRWEFTSFINIRPHNGNKGILIENPQISSAVQKLAEKLLLSPNESVT